MAPILKEKKGNTMKTFWIQHKLNPNSTLHLFRQRACEHITSTSI
jgi:hypothetical protein